MQYFNILKLFEYGNITRCFSKQHTVNAPLNMYFINKTIIGRKKYIN